MELLTQLFENLKETFGIKFLLSPLYVAGTVAIVYAIWLWRGKPDRFLRFMLPKELYVHPSTFVDIKIALFNTLFTASGVFSALVVTPGVTIFILDMLGGSSEPGETGLWHGILIAALLVLTQDFCRYWNHYMHHETRALWPFHAVHHSAEVLTPITFLRAHPLYTAIQTLLISVAIGLVQGLVLYILVGWIDAWVIVSASLVFNLYVFFGGHLRHSHIWLSYGPVLERILISPAQHQIHHSSDPKHHDKNYGEIFAIWDWMFGTLYIPDGPEDLTFGIADRQGVLIEQPYPTLKDALIGPFVEVWEDTLKGTSRDPEGAAE